MFSLGLFVPIVLSYIEKKYLSIMIFFFLDHFYRDTLSLDKKNLFRVLYRITVTNIRRVYCV